ncbi:MAG TPA: TetR/AcrR family transcriptional regulator [Solirubrobacterales bacterium]|nr:TetR/AcrR family transcriptional regulator [Solirubrobacterales bacterium]
MHQRARLHEAMVELAAEHGYNAFSVAALVKRARVSKRDFYKHFSGKEECFLDTYDIIINRSLRGIHAAVEGEEERHERLRLGFLTFADQLADNPEAARLALVEIRAAGTGAIERMLRANRLIEALVAKCFTPADGSPRLPRLLVKGIVAGCYRVARARLLSEHPRQLTLDREELMRWALSFCDDDIGRLRGLGLDGAPPLPATPARPSPGDERAMILAATARLASTEGSATLTVPRVRAAAGVSGSSFYAHFDGVADCFRTTLDTLSGRTLEAAEPFYLTTEDWASGVHRMIVRLCQHLAGDPTLADLAFREGFSPGPETIEWRSEMIARLAAMLRRGAPPTQKPTVLAAEASIGAMWGVVHHFVAGGSREKLPIAAPVLSYIALAPAIGGAAAVEAMVAPPTRGRPAAKRSAPDRNSFDRALASLLTETDARASAEPGE